ncbi:hypothetical protein Halha_0085 [Halobacteroides halobius DSM 5150]|uniref:Uncharacterized protein n=1 Tax=Halobacteroides halobius (strain ATCC 35273 / DSM 5150 / MD-1) TaxID=748449 RepID=L0K6E0_HALHC|nr:hypothetical protein [Halobacteroides halobius]AGB40105.1 hypothetical protein Halha_0085 [Halobacteroides halobius DSM 5150]
MSKIKQIIENYKQQIFSLDNVIGVGEGYKEVNGKQTSEECIVVLVEEKLTPDELSGNHIVPESLDEQKTDVIEIGKVELLGNNSEIRTTKLRPAQPGISIGHYKITAGTFGAVVTDNNTGEKLILSNNHVLANITNGQDGRAQIGDPILQPGSYDGGEKGEDTIAYLERFVPIYDKQPPSCPLMSGFRQVLNGVNKLLNSSKQVRTMNVENKVDCALAKPKEAKVVDSKILDIGTVKGVTEPKVGMAVKKSGRTTGLTESEIKAVNATLEVQLSASRSAIFTDQIVTKPFSKPGDSGSLVLNKQNQAVGLLFAGSDKSTICNKITNVLDALEVSFN